MKTPFYEERHEMLSQKVRAFGDKRLRSRAHAEEDSPAATRTVALLLASADLLGPAVPPPHGSMDLRSLVVVREGLAYFSGLADATFATQGLGSLPISLAGTEVQKNRWLPAIVGGEILCAFAVTEPEAGSDVAAIRTRAERDGSLWRLEGVKTLVSNAGIAGVYTVLARTSAGEGRGGLSMLLVDAEAPGITVKPLEAMAPQALGEIRFGATPAVLLGEEGSGYDMALSCLEVFRPTVGAAACGLAARALDEALRWALARRQFGRHLAHFQATRMALAEMHVDLEAARLLVRQAAWVKDVAASGIARDGAAAKLFATEMAQRVVDRAVQIHGGQGVMSGSTVERLYREVRALRIDGGTSEIQKLVIAREMLKESR
jgi:acyl-CoA dehydrogenase